MKFRTFCVLIVVLTFCMSGCAMYGNEKQYDKGEWYLWASSAEVARKKQDELALEKVRLQEGKTGRKPCASKVGYPGDIGNDYYESVSIKISGPENRSFCVPPNSVMEDIYLTPGRYRAEAYCEGELDGVWCFNSDLQIDNFKGKDVYWYLHYDP